MSALVKGFVLSDREIQVGGAGWDRVTGEPGVDHAV